MNDKEEPKQAALKCDYRVLNYSIYAGEIGTVTVEWTDGIGIEMVVFVSDKGRAVWAQRKDIYFF